MQWHCLSKEEVLKKLKVLPDSGLSEKEAFARQQAYGKNILEAKKGKSLLVRFFAQFADFMILNDFFTQESIFWLTAKSHLTMIHGEVVYRDF